MSYELEHIHFRCEDAESAIDYFVKVFEGKVIRHLDTPAMSITWVDLKGTLLCFSPKRKGLDIDSDSSKPHWGMYQLGLSVDDMDKAIEELKSKGAQFEGDPIEIASGVKVAFIKGPEGVQIELVQNP